MPNTFWTLAEDGKTAIPCGPVAFELTNHRVDLTTLALDGTDITRLPGAESIAICDISTVFLGLDHSFGRGNPVLWESMVFTTLPQKSHELVKPEDLYEYDNDPEHARRNATYLNQRYSEPTIEESIWMTRYTSYDHAKAGHYGIVAAIRHVLVKLSDQVDCTGEKVRVQLAAYLAEHDSEFLASVYAFAAQYQED